MEAQLERRGAGLFCLQQNKDGQTTVTGTNGVGTAEGDCAIAPQNGWKQHALVKAAVWQQYGLQTVPESQLQNSADLMA